MTTPPPQDPFSNPTGTPASSYGPPPSYGAPVQGYGSPPGFGAPQQTDSKAIIALVCAIGSFVIFPLVPAVVALVLASSSNREIEASGGRLTGEGLNTAAKVIAWINIGLSVLGVLLLVLALAAFISV